MKFWKKGEGSEKSDLIVKLATLWFSCFKRQGVKMVQSTWGVSEMVLHKNVPTWWETNGTCIIFLFTTTNECNDTFIIELNK